MQYINDIPILWILSSLVVYIPLRIFLIKQRPVSLNLFKELAFILLIIYVESLLYFTIFPSPNELEGVRINLIPFDTIYHYILYQRDLTLLMINLLGNIVVFIPIGIFAVLFKRDISFKQVLLIGFASTFFIEVTQLVFSYIGILSRAFDIDDLILNTIGVLIGYCIKFLRNILNFLKFSK